MQTPPGGAPRSPDGRYWWDGGRWQPVTGSAGRWRRGRRLGLGLAAIGFLLVAEVGVGVLLDGRLPVRPKAAPAKPVAVSFEAPSAFVEDDNDYKIAVPLYRHLASRWVRPADEPVGFDVIFVNSYVTGENASGESTGRILKRIAGYDRQVSAVHVTRPAPTRVAHRDAWSQYVYQPLPQNTLAMYDSTYVFVGRDLVQIGCQWGKERSEVMTGCQIVLRTLRISR